MSSDESTKSQEEMSDTKEDIGESDDTYSPVCTVVFTSSGFPKLNSEEGK